MVAPVMTQDLGQDGWPGAAAAHHIAETELLLHLVGLWHEHLNVPKKLKIYLWLHHATSTYTWNTTFTNSKCQKIPSFFFGVWRRWPTAVSDHGPPGVSGRWPLDLGTMSAEHKGIEGCGQKDIRIIRPQARRASKLVFMILSCIHVSVY